MQIASVYIDTTSTKVNQKKKTHTKNEQCQRRRFRSTIWLQRETHFVKFIVRHNDTSKELMHSDSFV